MVSDNRLAGKVPNDFAQLGSLRKPYLDYELEGDHLLCCPVAAAMLCTRAALEPFKRYMAKVNPARDVQF